jgi:hypothetical protein
MTDGGQVTGLHPQSTGTNRTGIHLMRLTMVLYLIHNFRMVEVEGNSPLRQRSHRIGLNGSLNLKLTV